MNILVDLVHPADVNLFKNAIRKLEQDGHLVSITLRERGKLAIIAQAELEGFRINYIGRHEKGVIKKVMALIKREIDLFRFIRKNKIQISVNQGFSSILSCRLLGIPFLQFEDDYEYKLAFYYNKLFAKRDIMPDFIPARGRNVYKYHGFKELAYLHPKVFTPSDRDLSSLGVAPLQYVFIREISNISLNYSGRRSYLGDVVDQIHSKGLKIVLSLEDKSLEDRFREKCIILREPVRDIYSLMANALFAISSGDTMAREACLLSTPGIYTGGRLMLMNAPMIEKGIMFKEDALQQISERINFFLEEENALKIREKARKTISQEWEDTTAVILKHILDFDKN